VTFRPGGVRLFFYGGAVLALIRLALVAYAIHLEATGWPAPNSGRLLVMTLPELFFGRPYLTGGGLLTAAAVVVPLSFLYAALVTALAVALRRLGRG